MQSADALPEGRVVTMDPWDPRSDMCMLHGRGVTNGSSSGPSVRHVHVVWPEGLGCDR